MKEKIKIAIILLAISILILESTLVKPEDRDRAIDLLLTETTTIGLRHYTAQRKTLPREIISVDTPLGTARVKKVTKPDGRLAYYPEFEDVKRISEQTQRPLEQVYRDIGNVTADLEKS